MSRKGRTKRKSKPGRRSKSKRTTGKIRSNRYSKGAVKGNISSKIVKAHADALRASGPIAKKTVKWTANKMKDATRAASGWVGHKIKKELKNSLSKEIERQQKSVAKCITLLSLKGKGDGNS